MAQTVEYWQQLIIDQLAISNITVSGSRTSVRRIWTFVIAFCIWTLDVLFDLHSSEIKNLIAEKKPHRPNWYKNKALDFQYGYDLIQDSDIYDNTGLTQEQIDTSKIIKYCAVDPKVIDNRSKLIIKVATEINGKLAPLSLAQLDAFTFYMFKEVQDAGVDINIINYLPDRLYLGLVVYYNPLVLDAQGNSILNGGKPVEVAINQYMKELPFNGELVLAYLTDKLQDVPGCEIPVITYAQTSWIDGQTNDYGEIDNIGVKRIPESGYFEIVNFNNVSYVPNI